jgi:uncharacterized protein (TIGR02266 family)
LNQNDRFYDRIPFSVEVEYRTASSFLVAYSANLSKGGIFLETSAPLAIGTELALKFTVPSFGTVEVRGLVCWVRPTPQDGKPAGMGVEFEQLDHQFGATIDRMVQHFVGLRVVVVAGSSQGRAILSRAVKSMLQAATVVEAAEADTAEVAFREGADLVLIDLDDSAADGLLAIRFAKMAPRPVPVICSARDDRARDRARELGADEVLPPAAAAADLTAAVMRALSRPHRVL